MGVNSPWAIRWVTFIRRDNGPSICRESLWAKKAITTKRHIKK